MAVGPAYDSFRRPNREKGLARLSIYGEPRTEKVEELLMSQVNS